MRYRKTLETIDSTVPRPPGQEEPRQNSGEEFSSLMEIMRRKRPRVPTELWNFRLSPAAPQGRGFDGRGPSHLKLHFPGLNSFGLPHLDHEAISVGDHHELTVGRLDHLDLIPGEVPFRGRQVVNLQPKDHHGLVRER
jgi:hypothetical protein